MRGWFLHAQGWTASATDALRLVSRACSQIRSSNALATILRALLAVGNVLNYGSARGGAQAVKMEFLLKLHEFRVGAASPPACFPRHCPSLLFMPSLGRPSSAPYLISQC